MKVLFLDIDGVLNTDRDISKFGAEYINENSLDLLKNIIVSTNAQIVLSSTWRVWNFSKKILEKHLHNKKMYILDSTPFLPKRFSSPWANRSGEIKHWLAGKPQIKRYAILDDDPTAGEGLEDNFFQVDSSLGLTEEITSRVINHLNI